MRRVGVAVWQVGSLAARRGTARHLIQLSRRLPLRNDFCWRERMPKNSSAALPSVVPGPGVPRPPIEDPPPDVPEPVPVPPEPGAPPEPID
jgi:hypothetical protein